MGVTSDTIILNKAIDDLRYSKLFIPIKDSVFEYTLKTKHSEPYELIYLNDKRNGAWKPILIFPENGVINCTLYSSKEFNKNEISGPLNQEYTNFQKNFFDIFSGKLKPVYDSLMALRIRDDYYDAELKQLNHQLPTETNGDVKMKIFKKLDDAEINGIGLSQKASNYRMKIDSIKDEANKWKYKYIEENISPVSYYLMFQDLQRISYMKMDVNYIKNAYTIYSQKLPDHPYTQVISEMLNSLETIRVGGMFPDFSAPDLNGKIIKLSDVIKNKYALIDLWSSWCGPCIKNSRDMIPIYEEFKDKGFIICGVAAEINNTDQLVSRLEKEKFPWINLVDLDHKNQIWYKYGIQNSGGGTFLVDPNGKFLAIKPFPDEVRKILSENLK